MRAAFNFPVAYSMTSSQTYVLYHIWCYETYREVLFCWHLSCSTSSCGRRELAGPNVEIASFHPKLFLPVAWQVEEWIKVNKKQICVSSIVNYFVLARLMMNTLPHYNFYYGLGQKLLDKIYTLSLTSIIFWIGFIF